MSNFGYVKLKDICDIERAVSDKIYPPGTNYIQVSACAKSSAVKWHITDRHTNLSGKYAVVIPKVSIIPEYLNEALEYTAEEFFERYIGSSINIQMNLFDFYKVPFYPDKYDQQRVLDTLRPIKQDIEATEKEIDYWGSLKGYFIEKMFVQLCSRK